MVEVSCTVGSWHHKLCLNCCSPFGAIFSISWSLSEGTVKYISKKFFSSVQRFEHYGSDLKRTMINNFLSSTCWSYTIYCFCVQSVNIGRYFAGPLPKALCFLKTVVMNSVALQILMFLDGVVLTRYTFIFILKNPFHFKDEFWWVSILPHFDTNL